MVAQIAMAIQVREPPFYPCLHSSIYIVICSKHIFILTVHFGGGGGVVEYTFGNAYAPFL